MKMIDIGIDLLSGKIVKSIYLNDRYDQDNLTILFEDGTELYICSRYDGGVFTEAFTPKIEE